MRANDLDSTANEQREEEKIKEVSQSHPQWEPELECVVHNAKQTAGDSAKAECYGRYLSRMLALADGIYQGAVMCLGRNIWHKQNAGCRFLRFVIRHCSRCAAKTELCVTLISFEALVSFDSKVFTAYPQMIN
jgi:hypothetical protein